MTAVVMCSVLGQAMGCQFGGAGEEALGFRPGKIGDSSAEGATGKVTAAEMDASVAAGHTGLSGGCGECVPMQSDEFAGRAAGFDLGAAFWQRDGVAEAVGAGKERQDAC
jgi:hypothetical protein